MNDLNIQPILKQDLSTPDTIAVNSIFLTIQGEGPFAGQMAVFIRLAGCNLQCPFCDTEYSSSTNMSVPLIVAKVLSLTGFTANPLVVITGGEPFRQNLSSLIGHLLYDCCRVQIETNGSLYQELPFEDITVVCSPKTGSINKKLSPYIDALKYIIHADDYSQEDGLPNKALGHKAHPRLARPPKDFNKPIYIQPIDVGDIIENHRHLEAAMESVFNFQYILCLQIHKIINVE